MIIYPAIDIQGGQCVRLIQGQKEQSTVYGNNLAQVALSWQEQGATMLHLVDLDGAFDGISPNYTAILNLLNHLSIPVQIGGGIRTMDRIDAYLSYPNVARVILGTSAVANPTLLRSAVLKYGDRIVVGIDAKDGMVAIHGWVEKTDLDVLTFAKDLEALGVKTIIYTDISKDGMLSGPNLDTTAQLLKETSLEVIASGGVGQKEDLANLQQAGAHGVIVGKALYEKRFTLAEALELGGTVNVN